MGSTVRAFPTPGDGGLNTTTPERQRGRTTVERVESHALENWLAIERHDFLRRVRRQVDLGPVEMALAAGHDPMETLPVLVLVRNDQVDQHADRYGRG